MDNAILSKIKHDGLLPLFYHDDSTICTAITKAIYEAGVGCVEFTNRGEHALENFKALVAQRNSNMPGLYLGVGTVASAAEAIAFIEAGADFLVSPFFDEGVSKTAKAAHIPWIPGCMTPGEVHIARNAGCTMVKLFPGNVLEPGFVEAIKPLFKGIDYVVTGGVEADAQNIKSWFKSGVIAVGMGSKLITKEILATGNYNRLTEAVAAVLEITGSKAGK